MRQRERSARRRPTEGERLAVSRKQARGGHHRSVDGINQRTGPVNPDSAADTRPDIGAHGLGGSESGGMAGPVGYFEGEGNEGSVAPLGGTTTKSAADGEANSQGGVASGAPG